MAISSREVFTFTWRIEHWSFCPQATGERIDSPIFSVDFLERKYCLWTYPRGKIQRKKNHFGIFLNQCTKYDAKKPAIGFAFTLLTVTGKEIKGSVLSYELETNEGCGFPTFCTREVILNTENGHLPNDTLTLKCEIWKAVGETNDGDSLKAEKIVPDVISADSDLFKQIHAFVASDDTLDLRTQFGYNECTVITRIVIGNKSVQWPIRRFSELRPDQKLSMCVPTSTERPPSFFLTVYLNEERLGHQNLQIEIQTHPNASNETYFVKCKIVLFNPMNTHRYVKEAEHLFVPGAESGVWKFPGFTDVKQITKSKCFSWSHDTMFIRCEFSFTSPEDIYHVEQTNFGAAWNETLLSSSNNCIGPLFKELCNSDKFSDVTIRTGDHDFKAHIVVLSTHSTVFSAMFENDMLEKQKGVVDIEDIEKNAMEVLLQYMYGHDLKINQQADAVKLYSAADKYEIMPLKRLCSYFLKSNLSVSNLCSVLTLADLHEDDDLMDEVKYFIRLHATEIFNSPSWTAFMQSNGKLAADIMLTMLKN